MAVIDFNVSPYYDDFETNAKGKGYHRVLFRPGFPVQARELTQLQSILQNQIDRFGKHMFEDGSMVIPGDINFDLEYDFVKIQSTFNATNVESYRTDFLNKIIIGGTTGIRAKVIGTVAATSSDPLTLYIKYETSGTSDNNFDTKKFENGEIITSLNANNTTIKNPLLSTNQTTEISAQLQTTDATGTGSAVKINPGVYFINGFFVANTEQTILLDKYSDKPSYRIGFEVTQSTVTPEEDTQLNDNAQGSSNYAAPGAHRYDISVTLVKKTLTETTDTNFVELARLENGTIQRYSKYADYAILEQTLARRTFDESGDYEVKPFQLDIRENLLDGNNRGVFTAADGGLESKLALGLEPGKAYVKGYEIESYAKKFIPVDKPRTFDRETDKPIQTPIGNFIVVKNVTGMPDIDEFEVLDIHDDLKGGSPAVIGTCRVRGFILHSGDYTGTQANMEFKLGIFDIKMNDGKDFTRDARGFKNSGNTFTCDIKPTLKILQGTATTTTSSTALVGQGTSFLTELKTGDVVFIDGERVGEIASATGNNLSKTLTANGLQAKTAGVISRFEAPLTRPDQKILVFPTNFFRMRKVRGDSVSNPDNVKSTSYTVRRKFATATVASGSVSFTCAGTNETFTSIASLKNYTLIVNTGQSPTTDGEIADITSSNLALSGSDRTLTISNLGSLSTNALADGTTVDLIASVRVASDDGVEKSKTLNSNSTVQISTAVAAQKTEITLGKADGFALKSVKMAADFSTNAVSTDTDITNRFTFDDGQRDAFYDLCRIKLKPGQPVPTGRLLVTFDFFTHGAGDYFSVDSYDGVVDYTVIPQYKSKDQDGRVFDLRDCLDFRPRVADSGTSFTGSGGSVGELVEIGTNVEADFSYYLPRVDKVVIDYSGRTTVVEGVPQLSPHAPQDIDDAMTLFEVSYLPYVLNTKEVVAKKIDNKRYTMRDIGKIEKRVTNLEYYTSLNLLEKETADLVLKDANGLDRLKNGFIVDNFSGHNIGNVLNEDYRISMDFKQRIVRPMSNTEVIGFTETASTEADRTTAGYKKYPDGIIMLPSTDVEFIKNPYATDSVDTNPYKVAPYGGEIFLRPSSDDWHDTTRRPDLLVEDDSAFDAIKFLADEIGVEGTVWNGWQDNWFGQTEWTGWQTTQSGVQQGNWIGNVQQQVGTLQVGQVNSGIQTTLQSSTVNKNLGDRIVSMSMIPFMRSIPVHVVATNMKPDTKVFAFFDETNVSDNILQDNTFTVTSDARANFEFKNFPSVGAEAQTDSARSINGDFPLSMSAGDVIRNQTHTATTSSNVAVDGGTGVVTVTVASTNGISVGHHVQFSNLAGENGSELNFDTTQNNNFIVSSVPSSSSITVTTLAGGNPTIASPGAHTGTVQRLQASAIVVYQMPDDQTTVNDGTATAGLPIDINVTNIKNGFAINDICTGTLANANGNINSLTISGINGNTTATTLSTLKGLTDNLVINEHGVFTGVFTIPNNETTRFRTGERVFKLIDNINNNNELGLHSTKAERIFRATGINEEREQTILAIRVPEFVRDRVQDTRTISRTVTGGTRFQATQRLDPPGRDDPDPGPGGHDPLAQTFTVDGVTEGCFLTKVDLFFSTKGVRPVLVQLTDVFDGHPGNKILASKTIQVEDVNVSDDAQTATTVTFDSPVFVKENTDYAIVIKCDEPGLKVYFSEIGGSNLGDNRTVSANPLTGTMFLSQNGSTWTPHQQRDVKFTLYRANFNVSTGTVTLTNNQVPLQELETNPFETNTNTNKVRVKHRNHGFKSGDKVTISGVPSGVYGGNSASNGIPATELNGQHVVLTPTIDSYVIEVTSSNITGTTSALVSDFVGGTTVKASRNVKADVLQPTIASIKLPNTSLSTVLDISDTSYTMSGNKTLMPNDNFYSTKTFLIANADNQATNFATQGYSAKMIITLGSNHNTLSPVLDSERISLCAISNRIDNETEATVNNSAFDNRTVSNAVNTIALSNTNTNMTTANADRKAEFLTLDIGKTITVSGASNSNNNKDYVVTSVSSDGATVGLTPAPGTDESASANITVVQKERFRSDIAPTGATNQANYLTKRFVLENPATAIKILYEMNRPTGTILDVYYKIIEDGQDLKFDDIAYRLSATDVTDTADEEPSIFRERQHTISGLNAFSTIAVKLVFKSSNSAYVPQVKNLRVLALAT